MRTVRFFLLISVMGLLLASARPVRADAAPPPPPPGTTLKPGESITMVQMVAEEVLMTLGDDSALVEAVFHFQNQGPETESFDVRFPLCLSLDYCNRNAPITDFRAWVDDVSTDITTIEEAGLFDEVVPWAAWPATFPPGVPVEVTVSYRVPAGHVYATATDRYLYILETGAGWYGPIGAGTITIRLPYEASEKTVVFGGGLVGYDGYVPPGGPPVIPTGYTFSGADLVWTFTDLEPTYKNNVEVVVLDPVLYRTLREARSAVKSNPDSLDAQLHLAQTISDSVLWAPHEQAGLGYILRSKLVADLIPEAVAAYQRALHLAPDNLEILSEYVDFLFAIGPSDTGEMPEDFFPTLLHGLALDPQNEHLHSQLENVLGVGIPWPAELGPTPTGLFSPSPTLPPLPGPTLNFDTPWPSQTPLPTYTPRPAEMVSTPSMTAPAAAPTSGGIPAGGIIVSLAGLALVGAAALLVVLLRTPRARE